MNTAELIEAAKAEYLATRKDAAILAAKGKSPNGKEIEVYICHRDLNATQPCWVKVVGGGKAQSFGIEHADKILSSLK